MQKVKYGTFRFSAPQNLNPRLYPHLRIDGPTPEEVAPDTQKDIDLEIRTLVRNALDDARKVLTEHKNELQLLADTLLQKETMSVEEKLQSTSLEFETFCAGVRYQAMEHGEERIVALDLQNRKLIMKEPETEEETDTAEEEEKIRTSWTFPEEFSIALENDPGTESIELFRFFPDGGASGMRELVFRYKSMEKRYKISPLTGRLFAEESEE